MWESFKWCGSEMHEKKSYWNHCMHDFLTPNTLYTQNNSLRALHYSRSRYCWRWWCCRRGRRHRPRRRFILFAKCTVFCCCRCYRLPIQFYALSFINTIVHYFFHNGNVKSLKWSLKWFYAGNGDNKLLLKYTANKTVSPFAI